MLFQEKKKAVQKKNRNQDSSHIICLLIKVGEGQFKYEISV